jgi:hypothetical protein
MSIALDDARLNQTKFLQLYGRLAQIQLSTLVNSYNYHSIKRLLCVEGDDVEACADDPLSHVLVEGIKQLPSLERADGGEQEVDAPASMAALFQEHELARALKPKLFAAFDLRAGGRVCGVLTCCSFERDDALSTSRFTQAYCAQHGLPRVGNNWLLVDVVASAKQGTGALLVLQAIVAAARAKYTGICSVAVTKGGRRLFDAFNFSTDHSWRERGGTRHFAYARMDQIHLADIHKRLRIHGMLVEDVCFRNGLTTRSAHTLIGRC